MRNNLLKVVLAVMFVLPYTGASAQIGKTFPSEKKVIEDPVTGTMLTFLTSTPAGDSKIYQTHNQWTADLKWLIVKTNRLKGEAMAVNEATGEMVQVTEGGFTGMLNIARKSMKLYFMRRPILKNSAMDIVEVDLEKVFEDSKKGTMQEVGYYQRICGTTPPELQAGGDMALDGGEEWVWFRVGKKAAEKNLPEGTKLEQNFGPRNMGAGPSGIAGMNIHTGEIKYVVSTPFQIGHIQSNPWVDGQIIFCWETGGKSPQRTWIVNADGSGLRPLYPEAPYEWVTHEAVISKDEVAIAIMGHRKIALVPGDTVAGTGVNGANPGQEKGWGISGTREKPTGLAVVNINTREMVIAGQTKSGSGLWHVSGSPDGRFLVGDDFARNIYLIDRHTNEMILLSAGHKVTAADHPHPTFSPDGTKIQIQSAMLSPDGRSMNICVIPVPEEWLKRKL
jgi:oligogalacturonide lyase